MTRRTTAIVRAFVAVAASAGIATLAFSPAAQASPGSAAKTSYSSIFADEGPKFTHAGWDTCGASVTWSVDVSQLGPKAARIRVADLQWALDQWSAVTGLSFEFAGRDAFTLDQKNAILRSQNEEPKARHVAFSFLRNESTKLLNPLQVGIGSPLAESVTTPDGGTETRIISGSAIFSVDYLAKASTKDARALLLHEIGHVMGLGHVDDDTQVMFPILDGDVTLGDGDIAGARALTSPCAVEG